MNKHITNGLLIGTTLITLANCNRAPLHLFENIFHPIVSLVNTFIKSNDTNIEDLELINTDTIQVDSKKLNNPKQFLEELKNHGVISAGKVITGSKIKYDYGLNFNGKMGMGWHIKCDYSPKYLPESIQVLVKNEIFTTKEEDLFFVTVDFYGKRNPKIPERHFNS